MKEVFEKLDDTTVRIEIKVSWQELEKKYHENLRKLGSSIRIRGFRPGKAPVNILEKLFGNEVLNETAIDSISDKIKEIIRKEKLFPLNNDLNLSNDIIIDEKKDVSYSGNIEIFPSVGELDFKGFTLQEKKQIDDKVVEEEIYGMAMRGAPVISCGDDELSHADDIVVISGKIEYDESGVKPTIFEKQKIDISKWSDYPEEFKKLFIGKKKGDKIVYQGDFIIKEGGNKTAPGRLDCEVNEVLRRKIPQLDDDLARDFSYNNYTEMKDKVKSYLEKEAENIWIIENGKKIIDFILSKKDFQLPQTYKKLIEERLSGFPADGVEKEKEEFEKELKRFVLMQSIGYEYNLLPSIENLSGMLQGILKEVNRLNIGGKEKAKLQEKLFRNYMAQTLIRSVSKFLVDKALEWMGTDHAQENISMNKTESGMEIQKNGNEEQKG